MPSCRLPSERQTSSTPSPVLPGTSQLRMRFPAPRSLPAGTSRPSPQSAQPVIVNDFTWRRCSTPPRSTAHGAPVLSHSTADGPPLSAQVPVHLAPDNEARGYIPADAPVLAVDVPWFSRNSSSTSNVGGSGPLDGGAGGFGGSLKLPARFDHQWASSFIDGYFSPEIFWTTR